ncbi:DUF1682 domain protein [Cordyceps fumosorosea ARSEF 2679]|uniref:DUF1682 domain protein n=1 Tax=Cordyceps fumosorosea (strain ARSEF 2679) TaxID=1081104 RepID=A0A167ZF45_CORFA|nr:DUF1682 domain protein [Cordyceps fumosorosea ARSEF 2679]OAA67440.1 DUF1682 domain protein [Cordyceps fumosorosea ARSEF 2679]
MADILKNVLGGKQAAAGAKADSDFADFASAADPAPAAGATLGGATPLATGRPYTKWYNIHERHSLSEFKVEGVILLVTALIFIFHFFGASSNRTKAKKWMRSHAAALQNEFALVGFGRAPTVDTVVNPDTFLKEKSLFEFASYATGRKNIAFLDVKITLTKKFNPIVYLFETVSSFLVESLGPAPEDVAEVLIYPFDGKESLTVPRRRGAEESESVVDTKSQFDGFVWAVVNKTRMQRLRDQRYDVSLTVTKDNSKLPEWLTVMSESAEITDTFLTADLIAAIVALGDNFQYLVASDQPTDSPTTLDETTPRKRLHLKYSLPSDGVYDAYVPLFAYLLRMPDQLVAQAHFRPEVLKKLRGPREQKINQIKKVAEEERAEERAAEKEKAKKAKRDAELKGLDAKAQKKYLEKEQAKEQRKAQKKMTMR